MKKILLFCLTFSLVFSIFGGSVSAAPKQKSQQDIIDIRNYVQKTVPLLKSSLESLPENTSLDKVEKTISNHYKNNPAPKAFSNPDISLYDVFPEMKSELEKFNGKAFNMNSFMAEQEKNKSYGNVLTFETNNSTVKVYLGDMGDIQILEQKTLSGSPKSDANVQGMTKTERSTGIAIGLGGQKLFTLWAEGRFNYDGKKVTASYKDGDYKRHMFGTALAISPRVLGQDRDASHGGYAYREVYSRIYVESIIGFKWAGIVLNSALVEAYIGSTAQGSIYGGVKKG
ncbi:hypothetical protein [Bacillus vallismortis]|uniref:hypothetical protein n=1 Tax=Bacillus vallismortis TaxID=72361 RepID=UPI003DB0F413